MKKEIMQDYLLNEIKQFHKTAIPLIDYPTAVRNLRNKINKYIDMELLYLKRMFLNNEVTSEDYDNLTTIIKYNKWKYHNLVNKINNN